MICYCQFHGRRQGAGPRPGHRTVPAPACPPLPRQAGAPPQGLCPGAPPVAHLAHPRGTRERARFGGTGLCPGPLGSRRPCRATALSGPGRGLRGGAGRSSHHRGGPSRAQPSAKPRSPPSRRPLGSSCSAPGSRPPSPPLGCDRRPPVGAGPPGPAGVGPSGRRRPRPGEESLMTRRSSSRSPPGQPPLPAGDGEDRRGPACPAPRRRGEAPPTTFPSCLAPLRQVQ